uniref:Activator of Hsp90 ATPase AHSA1-like N-terminal domain-containing protein n=1 Tax=Araucaria cunninghamii TaxID=56994 RepID=A0A0D6R3C9_ARACU
MEEKVVEEQRNSSYRYWVRENTTEAAPPPVPHKLSADELARQSQSRSAPLGSVWNQAGTWEERNLSIWGSSRIKELLTCLDALEFSSGKAAIQEVSSCVGDASLVTVRNKKRAGYSYEIAMKFKGEWLVEEETKEIMGTLKVPEASFGELEDMQLEVTLKEDEEIPNSERSKIIKDLKAFLSLIREKMLKFEEELKDR